MADSGSSIAREGVAPVRLPSKTEALRHYRETIEPELSGIVARRDVTLRDLTATFLDRHGKVTSPRTVRTIRERMQRPLAEFGDTPLRDLERMTDEIAAFMATLPERFRHPVMLAFRQTLNAGVRYGYLTKNPAKLAGTNPAPPPRGVRVFTPAELNAVAQELDARGSAAVRFAVATGLRPGRVGEP